MTEDDHTRQERIEQLMASQAYVMAYEDKELFARDELRAVRLQLELLKPELIQQDENIVSTIVVFGSARSTDREMADKALAQAERDAAANQSDVGLRAHLAFCRKRLEHAGYYEQAREFGRIVSATCQIDGLCEYVVVTGGGPGVMEAANRGAHDVGAKSVGLNIKLPHEQTPNPYISPKLCFNFRYFAIRKMHFLMRAKALLACPGGFGTMDELFEALTLIQTRKMDRIPIVLLGRAFWERIINFPAMVDEGVISPADLDLFSYVETAQEAWNTISEYYSIPASP